MYWYLPLSDIKKIEYYNWTFSWPGYSKFVFILNNTEVDFYTYPADIWVKKYYKEIGQKIADFINVPFEM